MFSNLVDMSNNKGDMFSNNLVDMCKKVGMFNKGDMRNLREECLGKDKDNNNQLQCYSTPVDV
jgi:hypothetical protein